MLRKKWTDAMVADGILDFYKAKGSFPTVTALKEIGRNDLSNQIARRGGYLHWSKRLGIDRAASDSDTGWSGELAVEKELLGFGFSVYRQKEVKWPFDLLVDDVLRVDVKTAKYAEYGPCKGWFYRIGKSPQADLIALHQLDNGETYWLPWMCCPRTNITIARDGGKYAKFRNNVSILKDMIQTRKEESAHYLGIIQ